LTLCFALKSPNLTLKLHENLNCQVSKKSHLMFSHNLSVKFGDFKAKQSVKLNICVTLKIFRCSKTQN